MSYEIEETLYRIEDIMKLSTEEALTKREKFAMAAMQGNIRAFHDCDVTDFGEMAHDCVMIADALLAELEKDVEK